MSDGLYKKETEEVLRNMICWNRAAVKAAELALSFNEPDPELLKKINNYIEKTGSYIKKIREQKMELCSALTESQKEVVEDSLYDMNRGLVLVVKKIYPEALS